MDLENREACSTHDGNNIGKADTGNLIRSKNKRVVIPFPSGVALMNLEMKAAENFSYRTRINNIHNIFDITDSPIIKSKVDKNITRVAEQHYLMESLIILNKGLRIYQLQKRISIADAITVMDEN